MEQDYNYEKIEQFVKGNLKGTDLEDFREKLSQDKSLSQEVAHYQNVLEAFELKGMIKEVDQDLEKKAFFETKKQAKIRALATKKTSWKRPLSIAASIALVVIAGSFWYSNANYSDQSLSPLSLSELGLATENNIRSNEGIEDVFSKGILALNQGQLDEAANFFNSITAESTNFKEAQLYLAYTQYALQNYNESEALATQVINSTQDASTKEKAEWILLNTRFRLDQNSDRFQQLLKKIMEDKNHRYQKEAMELEEKRGSAWRKLVF